MAAQLAVKLKKPILSSYEISAETKNKSNHLAGRLLEESSFENNLVYFILFFGPNVALRI